MAIHGLIGPNGAGKTTAINVISGLLRPRAGTLTLDGLPFVPADRGVARSGIGRTFQTPAIFGELTALENVMTGTYLATSSGLVRGTLLTTQVLVEERRARERALQLLERIGFDRAACEVPAQRLPFALQRKMEIARVLASDPRLLLLDEPTAGLSPEEARAFVHLLRDLRGESDLTILLVEHNVPLVFGVCDRVTAMHEGTAVASDVPDVIRRHPIVVESYLGTTGDTASAPAPLIVRDVQRPAETVLAVRPHFRLRVDGHHRDDR